MNFNLQIYKDVGTEHIWRQKEEKKVKVTVVHSCLTLSGLNSPGQNTGVDSRSLLRVSSQPRDQTQMSHIAGGFFTSWATREAQKEERGKKKSLK